MTFDLTCQSCDTSFEVELQDVLDEPAVECPSCEARAPAATVEAVAAALEELYGQLALLHRRFGVTFEVDSSDIPAPWDRQAVRSRDDEEDEDEEEGADEEDWEDEEEAVEEDDER
jgi:hypothetical protein